VMVLLGRRQERASNLTCFIYIYIYIDLKTLVKTHFKVYYRTHTHSHSVVSVCSRSRPTPLITGRLDGVLYQPGSTTGPQPPPPHNLPLPPRRLLKPEPGLVHLSLFLARCERGGSCCSFFFFLFDGCRLRHKAETPKTEEPTERVEAAARKLSSVNGRSGHYIPPGVEAANNGPPPTHTHTHTTS